MATDSLGPSRLLTMAIIPYGAAGVIEPISFSRDDWHDGVISFDAGRREIRLVAIKARQQQRGAFRRLISVIHAAGYTPVVIQPVGHIMPAILRHWGCGSIRIP